MIEQTVLEQQRALLWHRRSQERQNLRHLLHESDEILAWLEECLLHDLRFAPGWVMPRLVAILSHADSTLPRQLGGERRPDRLMQFVYTAQERLMNESLRAREPARIIPLFR
ncbi:MAG: hypothetical protein M3Y62_09270 [Candidatus Dormibacteraeota bacterium]|uniref:hypothetical protein n=1 Tax=Candidatus Dormibacter sp. TaxID=2973982 RepID=UPI000DAFC706|nr:hypothetical protein [Candidatus Dormibacteraeota bacterium]PZR66635.1 MAG: hypothetical protein DLM66_13045 [Candidatus Dormibacteraeota bacterium]